MLAVLRSAPSNWSWLFSCQLSLTTSGTNSCQLPPPPTHRCPGGRPPGAGQCRPQWHLPAVQLSPTRACCSLYSRQLSLTPGGRTAVSNSCRLSSCHWLLLAVQLSAVTNSWWLSSCQLSLTPAGCPAVRGQLSLTSAGCPTVTNSCRLSGCPAVSCR